MAPLHVRLSQYGLPSVGMLKIKGKYRREEEFRLGGWEEQTRRAVHQPSDICSVFVHCVNVCPMDMK